MGATGAIGTAAPHAGAHGAAQGAGSGQQLGAAGREVQLFREVKQPEARAAARTANPAAIRFRVVTACSSEVGGPPGRRDWGGCLVRDFTLASPAGVAQRNLSRIGVISPTVSPSSLTHGVDRVTGMVGGLSHTGSFAFTQTLRPVGILPIGQSCGYALELCGRDAGKDEPFTERPPSGREPGSRR
jgi:hypothetical protein